MITIKTSALIKAPIQVVWDCMTDYQGMVRWPLVDKVEIWEKGKDHPNGKGCVREVTSGQILVREEITTFKPPHTLGYEILRINQPLEHKGGSINFEETAKGTLIRWESTFEPIGSFFQRYAIENQLKANGSKGMDINLKWIKRYLER